MASTNGQYDIIVFGATGYTGKLTAEHIVTHLPTSLKWALAGRSKDKLEAVKLEIKALNPDRLEPAIEICNLNDAELDALAKKTKVLISTVGPYSVYGEHAVKACAENGTHYLDVTGEVPWVAKMIKKYEKTAQKNGCIMIPQIGIESAPSDLVTWSVVNEVREKFPAATGTEEVILSLHNLSGKPSGGTLATVFGILDVFSLKELSAASAPYALSPIPGPQKSSPFSLITTLFGIRTVPDLGILTSSIAASTNRPIIHRSFGLLGGNDFYGPNFHVAEYMKARNYLTGIAIHFGLIMGALFLAIPPFRKIAKKYVYQPGEGPTKEETKKEAIEYRAIGKPDVKEQGGPRVFVRAHFNGSLYTLTGVLLAQAAISILKDDHKLAGGMYTPASLGQKFIDRLQTADFKFEKKIYQ